ncbi:MAG: hypothetical protein ACFCVH_12480 [Alphaproteobacteria bacterium]
MRRGHRSMHARIWLLIAAALPLGVALAVALSPGPPPADPGIEAVRAANAGD